jgi:hypothetical protein
MKGGRDMKGDSEFLNRMEIEIVRERAGWEAFRFGMLIAHSFRTRERLIDWLKEYFS